MTTIVGVEDIRGSVIVADSVTTSDNRPYQSFRMAKIVQREQTVIAAAGSDIASIIDLTDSLGATALGLAAKNGHASAVRHASQASAMDAGQAAH